MANNASSSDAGQFLQRQTDLLAAIRQAQSLFILRHEPRRIFVELLRILVTVTDSEYGSLAEVLYDPDGTPYALNLALSDISWDEDSRRLYEEMAARRLEFRNLDNLFCAAIMERRPIIANDPPRHPRSRGLPKGHPPLLSYLGIPLFFDGELIGVAGVANRPGGYDLDLVAFLEPLTATCAHLIWSVRTRQKEQQMTEALRYSEERYRQIVETARLANRNWVEDVLRDREANLEALIESTDDLIAARDLEGRLILFNQSFAQITSRLFGVLARVGLKTTDQLPEPHRRRWENVLRKIVTEDIQHHQEFCYDFGNGDIRTYDLKINPTKRDGKITGTVEFTRDITNQRQLEKMLSQYQFMVTAMADSVSLIDQNYIYQIINPEYLRRSGKKHDAIVGYSVAELMGRETFENNIKDKLDRCLAGETVHYREWFNFAAVGDMFVDVTYSPYRDGQDHITGVVVNARNITEIKQVENELRTAKEFSENLIASMQDGLSVIDKQGVHIDVNPAFCRITGFARDELIGVGPPHPYWPQEEYPAITHAFENIINLINSEGIELVFSRKNGERFPVIITPSILRDSMGNIVLYFATIKDISDRKQAERIIVDSKNELQQVYDSVPIMICQLNPDRKVIEANAYFRSFTGWPDHPISLSEKACGVLGCINSLDDPRGCGFGTHCKICALRLAIRDTLKTGHKHTGIEYKTILIIDGVKKDIVLLCSTALIQKNNQKVVLLSMVDITERKQTEEALQITLTKYEILFDTFPLGITISDRAGHIVESNLASEKLLGLPEDQHHQRQIDGLEWQIVRPDGTSMPVEEYPSVLALKEQRLIDNVEMGITQPSGVINWISVTAAPLPLREYGVVVTYGDITQRKKTEEALQRSLQEKETLLREVHHRVKNNLAAIISLLELQQDRNGDSQNQSLLAEMGSRIRSMALVHEMLYRSANLSEIDFDAYLQALVEHLRGSFDPRGAIRISVAAAGVRMNLDTAIPCGLIVNELVINALKYAFPAEQPGVEANKIIVTVVWDQLTYTLIVADNGVGLPADLDWTTTRTLGLRLVRMLGQHQLQGSIELDRSAGVRFLLRFGSRQDRSVSGEQGQHSDRRG